MRLRHVALIACARLRCGVGAAVRSPAEDVMPRPILDEARIHPAIRDRVASLHADTLREVQAALQQHALVVVGMAMNPFPRKARKLLDAAGVPYHYIGYGSYFSDWRRRNALKMWTGWPTLPMVFVKGQLVGGAADLARLIDSGELRRLLA
jgi:glutaredoxin-related protein